MSFFSQNIARCYIPPTFVEKSSSANQMILKALDGQNCMNDFVDSMARRTASRKLGVRFYLFVSS